MGAGQITAAGKAACGTMLLILNGFAPTTMPLVQLA
jgi:hypothetical protein